MKKRNQKFFPMDFHGDHHGWRFIIRAYDSTEVLEALRWQADITMQRRKFHLFAICVDTFSYTTDNFFLLDDPQDYNSCKRCIGPIVEVKKLNQMYADLNNEEAAIRCKVSSSQ